jgi:ribosomal 30S subunit maturation factor RimM
MAGAWHTIAKVRSVNPARRELRLQVESGRRHCLEGAAWLWVQTHGAQPLHCRVEKLRWHNGDAIAGLTAGVSRDVVGAMKGANIVTDVVPAPIADDFDARDLIGLEVFDRMSRIGVVVDAIETPAHIVIEVERKQGSAVLLPLAPELVDVIDFDEGRIVMREAAAVEVETGAPR